MLLPLRDDNPHASLPLITIGLIVINVGVFIYELLLPDSALVGFVYAVGLVPSRVLGEELSSSIQLLPLPLTFVTHMFVHGGWMHLIGNMWFLWIFGDNVEDRVGRLRFVLLYLLWGWTAAGAHILLGADPGTPMVGASGAIAGVLGAYAVLYPKARVHTFIFLVIYIRQFTLPSMAFLGLWFGWQFLSLSQAGVAWWAHIGGFVVGVLVAVPLKLSDLRAS